MLIKMGKLDFKRFFVVLSLVLILSVFFVAAEPPKTCAEYDEPKPVYCGLMSALESNNPEEIKTAWQTLKLRVDPDPKYSVEREVQRIIDESTANGKTLSENAKKALNDLVTTSASMQGLPDNQRFTSSDRLAILRGIVNSNPTLANDIVKVGTTGNEANYEFTAAVLEGLDGLEYDETNKHLRFTGMGTVSVVPLENLPPKVKRMGVGVVGSGDDKKPVTIYGGATSGDREDRLMLSGERYAHSEGNSQRMHITGFPTGDGKSLEGPFSVSAYFESGRGDSAVGSVYVDDDGVKVSGDFDFRLARAADSEQSGGQVSLGTTSGDGQASFQISPEGIIVPGDIDDGTESTISYFPNDGEGKPLRGRDNQFSIKYGAGDNPPEVSFFGGLEEATENKKNGLYGKQLIVTPSVDSNKAKYLVEGNVAKVKEAVVQFDGDHIDPQSRITIRIGDEDVEVGADYKPAESDDKPSPSEVWWGNARTEGGFKIKEGGGGANIYVKPTGSTAGTVVQTGIGSTLTVGDSQLNIPGATQTTTPIMKVKNDVTGESFYAYVDPKTGDRYKVDASTAQAKYSSLPQGYTQVSNGAGEATPFYSDGKGGLVFSSGGDNPTYYKIPQVDSNNAVNGPGYSPGGTPTQQSQIYTRCGPNGCGINQYTTVWGGDGWYRARRPFPYIPGMPGYNTLAAVGNVGWRLARGVAWAGRAVWNGIVRPVARAAYWIGRGAARVLWGAARLVTAPFRFLFGGWRWRADMLLLDDMSLEFINLMM